METHALVSIVDRLAVGEGSSGVESIKARLPAETCNTTASPPDSDPEGGCAPPPPKRARISLEADTGEPSLSSRLSAFVVRPTDSSLSASQASSSASQTMDSDRPGSSADVIVENGGSVASNGDVILTNGCSTVGEEDGSELSAHGHAKSWRKKQQRKLSGMDAEVIRLVGQHLREMGLQ